MPSTRILVGLVTAIALLSSCGGGDSPLGPTAPLSPAPSVTVSLSATTVSLAPGETRQLSAEVRGTTNTAISWTTDAATVATVSASGLVSALTAGTATITATSVASPTKSATATVAVLPPPPTPIQATETQVVLAPSVAGARPFMKALVSTADSVGPDDRLPLRTADPTPIFALDDAGNALLAALPVPGETTVLDGASTALATLTPLARAAILAVRGDPTGLSARITAHAAFPALARAIADRAVAGKSFLTDAQVAEQARTVILGVVAATSPSAQRSRTRRASMMPSGPGPIPGAPVSLSDGPGQELVLTNDSFVAFEVSLSPKETDRIVDAPTRRLLAARAFKPVSIDFALGAPTADTLPGQAGRLYVRVGQTDATYLIHTKAFIDAGISVVRAVLGLDPPPTAVDRIKEQIISVELVSAVTKRDAVGAVRALSGAVADNAVWIISVFVEEEVKRLGAGGPAGLRRGATLVAKQLFALLRAASILGDVVNNTAFVIDYGRYVAGDAGATDATTTACQSTAGSVTPGTLMPDCPKMLRVVPATQTLVASEQATLRPDLVYEGGGVADRTVVGTTGWTSRDPNVATVTQLGVVTAVASGGTWIVGEQSFGPQTFRDSARIEVGTIPMKELGPYPTGRVKYAVAINDAGQVAGTLNDAGNYERAFVLENGTARTVDDFVNANPTCCGRSQGLAINAAGDVLGSYQYRNEVGYAIWHNGVAQYVFRWDQSGARPTAFFDAVGMNDRGQVIGRQTTAAGSRAAIWQNGTVTELPGTDGVAVPTYALGINNAGQVVGCITDGHGECARAVIWENGTMRDISVPADGAQPGQGGAALAINDRGQVVIQTATRVYLLDDGKYRQIIDNYCGTAHINNRSQVVATCGVKNTGNPDNYHAWFWQDGGSGLLSITPGAANAINAAGQVVGVGRGASGFPAPVTWQLPSIP